MECSRVARKEMMHSVQEALVHQGMFTHPNPKCMAIIGGGEGATRHEIIQPKSVEPVTMVELD